MRGGQLRDKASRQSHLPQRSCVTMGRSCPLGQVCLAGPVPSSSPAPQSQWETQQAQPAPTALPMAAPVTTHLVATTSTCLDRGRHSGRGFCPLPSLPPPSSQCKAAPSSQPGGGDGRLPGKEDSADLGSPGSGRCPGQQVLRATHPGALGLSEACLGSHVLWPRAEKPRVCRLAVERGRRPGHSLPGTEGGCTHLSWGVPTMCRPHALPQSTEISGDGL